MGNFLANLFSSLFSGSDPESQKKRVLKNISKNLQRTKCHFYKTSSHEAEPGLGKFFYDIYKAIYPLQVIFQSTNKNALKNVVINTSLSEEQKLLLDSLSEEAINEQARKMPLPQLTEKVNQDIKKITSDFDSTKITKIDALYSKLVVMMNFCTYDYYFIVKKFDGGIREGVFTSAPRFNSINGSYVSEDIKNFIDVAWVLPFETDWDDAFKLIKSVKGSEPISQGLWRRVLSKVRTVKEKRIFEMLLQLILENPSYKDDYAVEDLHIADDYITQVKKAAETALDNIKRKQAEGKIEKLLSEIFGTTDVPKLKYYNELGSAPFERKQLGAFLYSNPLAYLKNFLIEYTKKNIRELSDVLVIRGEWTNQQLSKPMSEAFHQLIQTSEEITELDNSLAEEASVGIKLKTLLPRSERDKEARNIIHTTLKDVNNMAANSILEATKNFITYGRNLKMLLEDFVKLPKSELLMNWKELDHFTEGALKEMCIDVYKKIFAFVSLIQTYHIEIDED